MHANHTREIAFVHSADLELSARYAAMRAIRRHYPPLAIDLPVPFDEDFDRLDILGADLAWHRDQSARYGGWPGQDDEVDFGSEEFEPEDVVIDRYIRPRSRAFRVSAEEERDLWGWSR